MGDCKCLLVTENIIWVSLFSVCFGMAYLDLIDAPMGTT